MGESLWIMRDWELTLYHLEKVLFSSHSIVVSNLSFIISSWAVNKPDIGQTDLHVILSPIMIQGSNVWYDCFDQKNSFYIIQIRGVFLCIYPSPFWWETLSLWKLLSTSALYPIYCQVHFVLESSHEGSVPHQNGEG